MSRMIRPIPMIHPKIHIQHIPPIGICNANIGVPPFMRPFVSRQIRYGISEMRRGSYTPFQAIS